MYLYNYLYIDYKVYRNKAIGPRNIVVM